MTTLENIIEKVQDYASNADIDQLVRAYVFAAREHNGQMRKSGEVYFIHPLAVADILAELKMDVDTISAGLLHDTMEDCLCTLDELEVEFGPEVAQMVDGVTKLGKLQFRTKEEAQAESFRKLVLAMAHDVRVILVKLADRLHNMRTMEHMKPHRQAAISQETLDIYAPIANRLGLSRLKMELEDLCFRYLHPDTHTELTEALGSGREDRQQYIEDATTTLEKQLAAGGLKVRVKGRHKHLFSIFRKMRAQNLAFEQVHDLLAFRVFVDEMPQCYTVLGIIHSLYRHIPEKLKDYIANPKSNGYRSLHTVVIGPGSRPIEIQIRTRAMHSVAEVGIAAHWRYKEGHLALSRDDINKIARLRELFEAAQEVTDSAEFLETIKIELFSNEIFTFTPKGDVKFFPQGATVLDFAYAIHTEVGRTCAGAKVNGAMVPLRYVLRSGDTVRIIRKANRRPNRDWLNIACTGRALTKIRRQLREDEREKDRVVGRELLQQELASHKLNLGRVLKAGTLEGFIRDQGFRKPEELFLAIAQGTIALEQVITELVPTEGPKKPTVTEAADTPLSRLFHKLRRRPKSSVLISGQDNMVVNYARCCNPLPGEAVTGFISREKGITVHASRCKQLLALDPDRRVTVEWQKEARAAHVSELRLVCVDKPGMLEQLGAACKTLGVNVASLKADGLGDGNADVRFAVAVEGVRELNSLIRRLQRIKGIHSVERIQG